MGIYQITRLKSPGDCTSCWIEPDSLAWELRSPYLLLSPSPYWCAMAILSYSIPQCAIFPTLLFLEVWLSCLEHLHPVYDPTHLCDINSLFLKSGESFISSGKPFLSSFLQVCWLLSFASTLSPAQSRYEAISLPLFHSLLTECLKVDIADNFVFLGTNTTCYM